MALTYANYVAYAKSKGFQPVQLSTFNALVLAGFNPITNTWRGQSLGSSSPAPF
jgi:hypothetical protein